MTKTITSWMYHLRIKVKSKKKTKAHLRVARKKRKEINKPPLLSSFFPVFLLLSALTLPFTSLPSLFKNSLSRHPLEQNGKKNETPEDPPILFLLSLLHPNLPTFLVFFSFFSNCPENQPFSNPFIRLFIVKHAVYHTIGSWCSLAAAWVHGLRDVGDGLCCRCHGQMTCRF